MFVTAKSQEQGSGMSDGHRKRCRQQKLLGEFSGGREKRRRIEDPVSSLVAIMQKMAESKEKGRRRTSDWCCICMEEYKLMSIVTASVFLKLRSPTAAATSEMRVELLRLIECCMFTGSCPQQSHHILMKVSGNEECTQESVDTKRHIPEV